MAAGPAQLGAATCGRCCRGLRSARAAGLFTAWVERTFIGARGADFSLTVLERCLLAGRVIWFYLGKLVWPADLIFIYPRWNVDAAVWWQYLFPLGVLALVVGLALLARQRRTAGPRGRGGAGRIPDFCRHAVSGAGVLQCLPVHLFLRGGPFSVSGQPGHHRAAGGGADAGGRPGCLRRLRQLVPAGGGVLLATLGVLTWRQCGMYRDAETLYRETLARNPACWMAHNNLG